MPEAMLNIEVAYASETQKRVIKIQVEASSTVEQAIVQSQICTHFPEIDLQTAKIGIYSKKAQLTDPLSEGDRIEIYRPLKVTPMQARRLRSSK